MDTIIYCDPYPLRARSKVYLRCEQVLVVLEEEQLCDLSVHLGPGDAAQPDVLKRHPLHLVDGVPEDNDQVDADVRRRQKSTPEAVNRC